MKKIIFLLAMIFPITLFAQVDSVGNDPVISSSNPFIAVVLTFAGTWLLSIIGGAASAGGFAAWWTLNKNTFLIGAGAAAIILITIAIGLVSSDNVIWALASGFALTWIGSVITGIFGTGTALGAWWTAHKGEFWFQASALGTAIVSILFGVMPQ